MFDDYDEDKKFEDLAKRHPDLFEKSGDFDLSIGDGWYNIVDTLCGLISYKVMSIRQKLKYAKENPNVTFTKPIPEIEKELIDALEDLPAITQVKEKFGTLRFYVTHSSPEIYNYISFAEAMSACTCEVCGSPGKSRSGGWIRVLCDKHNKEHSIVDADDV